eukprot:CAMPEP_0195140482 /NCGR_PEP_ID=MMETSP0448-20130528/161218_1 /TAXON_ID=66468 /ORGANISM="Heterocapsa triquestra, Strain CCMP 448" /LENGTH=56 /DNA_ID=CAMNT_0040178819 /DNA_START=30 /DNA_END=197 /DNA_ORIENTATION=+
MKHGCFSGSEVAGSPIQRPQQLRVSCLSDGRELLTSSQILHIHARSGEAGSRRRSD